MPCLLLAVAAAQVALSFHHHDDLAAHDDCPVCVQSQQGLAAPDVAPPSVVGLSVSSSALRILPILAACGPVVLAVRSRGPPALS